MRKLLVWLLVLLLPAGWASAQSPRPYTGETVLSVLALTSAQRELVEYLYQPVLEGETRIDLPSGTRYDDVAPAISCLIQDYPEMFHLARSYSIGYWQNRPDEAAYVQLSYLMGAEESHIMRSRLYTRAKELVRSHPSPQKLHDLLLERVSYGGDVDLRHTAAGALLQGMATCEGYAQALTLLFRMGGIPCGIVSGNAVDDQGRTERHSWNIARIGGGYTLIDATWNDQDRIGLNTHWYYGLSTRQMGADHFPDADQALPVCTDLNNWHSVRGCVLHTQAEADAAIRRLISGETINVRIPSWQLYQQLAIDTYAYLEDYNARHPGQGFYGAYRMTRSDVQQCLILYRSAD